MAYLSGDDQRRPARILGCTAALIGLPLLLIAVLAELNLPLSNPFLGFAPNLRYNFLNFPPVLHFFLSLHYHFIQIFLCSSFVSQFIEIFRINLGRKKVIFGRWEESSSGSHASGGRKTSLQLVRLSLGCIFELFAFFLVFFGSKYSTNWVHLRNYWIFFPYWNFIALPEISNGYIRVDCFGGLNQMRRDVNTLFFFSFFPSINLNFNFGF